MLKDKLTQTLAEAYIESLGRHDDKNDFEEEHKKILDKLHKHLPHLELNKAVHTMKHDGWSKHAETHQYNVTHKKGHEHHRTVIMFAHGKDNKGKQRGAAGSIFSYDHKDKLTTHGEYEHNPKDGSVHYTDKKTGVTHKL